MKRLIFSIAIIALICSCRNQGSNKIDKIDRDSLAQINLARQQDSINRERIFAALGDTVFGRVCFGMNKTQYQKAFNEFKKPLEKTSSVFKFNFVFSGYEFHGDEGSDVERNNQKSIYGYPYGLADILKTERLYTYFFKERLWSVRWNSYKNVQDEQTAKQSMVKLISFFEKKYGIANVNNTELFSRSFIVPGVWLDIARWETKKKKIIISYRELVGGERDKWMAENHPSDCQYELEVLFIDKTQKNEVDEYIKPILQKYSEEYKKKLKQDSIANANAL